MAEPTLVVKPLQGNVMKSFVVLALAVVLTPAVFAQHQTFAVNPDASEVKMKLNTTHEVVNGIFHVQSGSIDFDRTASQNSHQIKMISPREGSFSI